MPTLRDPLTYENLMAGTVAHFKTQDLEPLASHATVQRGPGIYALYYKGGIPEYQPITGERHPIYAGKAVPPRGRAVLGTWRPRHYGTRLENTSGRLTRRTTSTPRISRSGP